MYNNEDPETAEARLREQDYGRDVHQAAARAYQLACRALENGKSAQEIVEVIGLFEDRAAEWREGQSERQPL